MAIAQHPTQEHLFVVATTDHTLATLDANKGSLIKSWRGHEDRINSLAFSQIVGDKDLVDVFFSAAEDGFVKVWNSSMCNMLGCIVVENPLYCIACNGKYLVAGSDQYTYIWDVRSVKLLKKIKSHSAEVTAIAFHPQNTSVWLTCGADDLLCQYNMQDPDILDYTLRSEQPLASCGFYGQSLQKQFAVTGVHSVELYDDVGNATTVPRSALGADDAKVVGAYFDSQRNVITAGSFSPGKLDFYDIQESGELEQSGSWSFDDSSVLRSCSPIRDGYLLVTSEDGNIYIGRQTEIATEFDLERLISSTKTLSVGPIKDYKGTKKSKANFI